MRGFLRPQISSEDRFSRLRKSMVEKQLRRRGIRDQRVLAMMQAVPRHLFVPENYRRQAYDDGPVPIGLNQTISQPYIVAYMLELLALRGRESVLEIGCGCGYQTALLSRLANRVYTMEILPELAEIARANLGNIAAGNVQIRVGDGYDGWPENAPFDAIIVSAAPTSIPPVIAAQLAAQGRAVLPVGRDQQRIILLLKSGDQIESHQRIPVRFVPMTGRSSPDPARNPVH